MTRKWYRNRRGTARQSSCWQRWHGMVPRRDPRARPAGEACVSAASSDGRNLYVVGMMAAGPAELPEGRVAQHIDLPALPFGLCLPGSATLIVACQRRGARSFCSICPRKDSRFHPSRLAGSATSPVVSADGERLYVCNRFDNDVPVIDLKGGRQIARVRAVREPVAADLTPGRPPVAGRQPLAEYAQRSGFRGRDAGRYAYRYALVRDGRIPPPRANSPRLCVSPDGRHAGHAPAGQLRDGLFRVDTGWIDVNVVSIIDIARRR